jgi:alkylation response protein AidB-like acyl-CoA dehydrogenase
MLWGVEIGRLNVAMCGVGTARRALELALTYAAERESFG